MRSTTQGTMRGRLGRTARAALFALATVLAAAPAHADLEKLADASVDRVNATTVVPDPSRKVGEVRLIERGEGAVVQTLLQTKLLARVIQEIRHKEEGNWPRGYEPTRKYLEALDAARETIETKREAGRSLTDRRRRMLIEFAADREHAVVLVGTFDSEADVQKIVPKQRRLFARLELPREYVLRNMRLILADSFRIAEREVDRLGPLGPAASTQVPALPPMPPPEAEPDAGTRESD